MRSNFYRDEYLLDATIKHFPKPYIALIHGIVMGGGVGVSVHGSHRIAGETTMFAMPETGIGLFPDVGGSYFLPRCPGQIGMYLALTGARLKTADTLYAGVATHFVPVAKWDELIERLADDAAPQDVLEALGELVPGDFLLSIARRSIGYSAATPSKKFWPRSMPSTPTGRATQPPTIRTKSPTSLKIAFRQMREGAKLNFDDCMKMEFRMVNRVVAGHDFYEGVRATIIDKDGAPKWKPSVLTDVSDADVRRLFRAPRQQGIAAMTNIAFIGVGNMGGPMARNLLKAAHGVHAFDLSRRGAEACDRCGRQERQRPRSMR